MSMSLGDFSKEVLDRVEVLQKDLHSLVALMMAANPKLEYQDAVTIYMLTLIAQLQVQVKSISSHVYHSH